MADESFYARVTCGRGWVLSDDCVLCYVLPVLWMTSCLPIIGETMVLIGRILHTESPGAEPGAKSDV